MPEDPIIEAIQAAIADLECDERMTARQKFASIWTAVEKDPRPLHECILAHYMADAQDDPVEELAWDERALAAAMRCSDAEAKEHHGSLSIGGFLPSLHLNLGDDYLRLGKRADCEIHLAAGLAACADLPDSPYGRMIRAALDRLSERFHAGPE